MTAGVWDSLLVDRGVVDLLLDTACLKHTDTLNSPCPIENCELSAMQMKNICRAVLEDPEDSGGI